MKNIRNRFAAVLAATAMAACSLTGTAGAADQLSWRLIENYIVAPNPNYPEQDPGWMSELSGDYTNGIYTVNVEMNEPMAMMSQLWYTGLVLESFGIEYGKRYMLTYSVKASKKGWLYAYLGDDENDLAEYWHQDGNLVDLSYDPGMSSDALRELMLDSATDIGTAADALQSNSSRWDIPYWDGWRIDDNRKLIPADTWVTQTYEFYSFGQFMENITYESPAPDPSDGVFLCMAVDGFNMGTTLQFAQIGLLDMETGEWVIEPGAVTQEPDKNEAFENAVAYVEDSQYNLSYYPSGADVCLRIENLPKIKALKGVASIDDKPLKEAGFQAYFRETQNDLSGWSTYDGDFSITAKDGVSNQRDYWLHFTVLPEEDTIAPGTYSFGFSELYAIDPDGNEFPLEVTPGTLTIIEKQQPEETTEPPVETTTEPPTETTTEATTELSVSLYGDIDDDGDVDLIDVITLNKFLMIAEPLSQQGLKNADVNKDNDITPSDALNILRSIVKLITLPIEK